jgi:ABC-2 type transport system ATP-binding protein
MIVNVKSLEKRYKKELVLKNIDITIEKPQIVALVGPNGSGKTTLLNCMTNLLSISGGEIELLGKKHTDPSLFYDVSYLQDNRILYGDLTGYDHLKFICDVQNLPQDKIIQVARRVGMESYLKKRVRNYSLGMKQHLLLSMAIINEPKLLLLDEPLTGLDPTSAITVRKILLELAEEDVTIILSSHNLDEIDRVTNRIYFLKDGTLLKESLEDFSVNKYHVSVDEPKEAKEILKNEQVPFEETTEGHFTFDETKVSLQTFIEHLNGNGIDILSIENRKVGAERRYRELFEGEESG